MDERVAYFERRNKIRDSLLNHNPKVLGDLGLDRISLTPAISNWLKQNGLKLKPHEAEQYANYLNDALHWYEEFRRVPVTAAVVHKLVDALIAADRKTDPRSPLIKCRGGCASCCHIKVSVTEEEGRILAGLVPPGSEAKLFRQSQARSIDEWALLSDDDAACVFLDRPSGHCTVYESRPSVCRLAYSLTGPLTCGRKPRGPNTSLVWFKAEAIVAAYISTAKIGGMANMVLEKLQGL